MNIFESIYRELILNEALTFDRNDPNIDACLKSTIDSEKQSEQNLNPLKKSAIGLKGIKVKEEKDQKPFALEAIENCVRLYNTFDKELDRIKNNPKSLELAINLISKQWKDFTNRNLQAGTTQPTKVFIINYLNSKYGFDIPIGKNAYGFWELKFHTAGYAAARKAIKDALSIGRLDPLVTKDILRKLNTVIGNFDSSGIEAHNKPKGSEIGVNDVTQSDVSTPAPNINPAVIHTQSKNSSPVTNRNRS